MGLVGDFTGLEELRDRLAGVCAQGFQDELADVLGAAALHEVDDEFRHTVDPYGNTWKPPVFRDGKALSNTGAMAASASYQRTTSGFKISIPKKQAKLHNFGGEVRPVNAAALRFRGRNGAIIFAKKVTMPRRQMVPDDTTGGLGPRWTKAFNDAASALLKRKLVG